MHLYRLPRLPLPEGFLTQGLNGLGPTTVSGLIQYGSLYPYLLVGQGPISTVVKSAGIPLKDYLV